jgi:hypothetical protein
VQSHGELDVLWHEFLVYVVAERIVQGRELLATCAEVGECLPPPSPGVAGTDALI